MEQLVMPFFSGIVKELNSFKLNASADLHSEEQHE